MTLGIPRPAGTARTRVLLLAMLLGLVAVSCGGSKDDRDEIRAEMGEPDSVDFTEGPYYDIEVWSYYDTPTPGRTRWFEFHKSKNSCGGGSSWSLYAGGTTGEERQGNLEGLGYDASAGSEGPPQPFEQPPPDTR